MCYNVGKMNEINYMAKYDEILTKEFLENCYHKEQLNPNQIADKIQCNHKTIRAYLKKHNIQLRNISEYNSLSHKTYTEPTDELLYSPLSIAMHSMYQCEGWYTNNTHLCFSNTDILLIKQFIKGLKFIYKYEKDITINIIYDFSSKDSTVLVEHYLFILDNKFRISFTDNLRKNPILRINAGGNNLSQLFSNNIKKINLLIEK